MQIQLNWNIKVWFNWLSMGNMGVILYTVYWLHQRLSAMCILCVVTTADVDNKLIIYDNWQFWQMTMFIKILFCTVSTSQTNHMLILSSSWSFCRNGHCHCTWTLHSTTQTKTLTTILAEMMHCLILLYELHWVVQQRWINWCGKKLKLQQLYLLSVISAVYMLTAVYISSINSSNYSDVSIMCPWSYHLAKT